MAVSPAAGGATTPAAGSTTNVDAGVAQNITASAGTDYHFVNWTANPAGNATFGNAASASTTVTLTGSATVTANFAINPTLTVNSGKGSGQYGAGAVVNIVANDPAAGQVFDQWTGDTAHVADVTSANTTVTMPAANVTVTATYKVQQIVYVSADGKCGNNTPCYTTLGEAMSKSADKALIKVAGNIAGDTVMDPAGTWHIEFGYDANFSSNVGGATEIQGTFTAKDKSIIRSGTIRGR